MVYGINNCLIWENTGRLNEGLNNTAIDLRNISPGFYILKFFDGENTSTRKLIKN